MWLSKAEHLIVAQLFHICYSLILEPTWFFLKKSDRSAFLLTAHNQKKEVVCTTKPTKAAEKGWIISVKGCCAHFLDRKVAQYRPYGRLKMSWLRFKLYVSPNLQKGQEDTSDDYIVGHDLQKEIRRKNPANADLIEHLLQHTPSRLLELSQKAGGKTFFVCFGGVEYRSSAGPHIRYVTCDREGFGPRTGFAFIDSNSPFYENELVSHPTLLIRLKLWARIPYLIVNWPKGRVNWDLFWSI